MISVGHEAPLFEAPLGSGGTFRLADYRARRHLILYFFPKDFTPGCTREACSFRDRRAEIAGLDAEVVGVSYDSAEKHAQFAEKYSLPYPLVSDAGGRVAARFGVTRLGGWLPNKRVTFVIDKDGIVRHVIHAELNIDLHIDEALDALRKMQGEAEGRSA